LRTWIKRCFFVGLGLLGFHAPNALAAVDMYLCIDGQFGSANETKTDTGCIDVLAWSWGASNSSSTVGDGKASFQAISITKYQDYATVWLLNRVADSQFIPAIDLRVRRSCGLKDCVGAMTFRLSMPAGGFVTSLSTGGSGGEDRLTENISIIFPAVEWCATEFDDLGDPLPEVCDGWNILTNEPYP